ncbi:Uncharacterised protein [Morganella morganii]|nr:Uncharacterised protein [Morganella morganii]
MKYQQPVSRWWWKASKTFPSGILITAFADDADPLDFPPTEIVKTGMDINGNLLSWSAPAPQTVTINVPAGSEEDSEPGYPAGRQMTAKRGRRAAGG